LLGTGDELFRVKQGAEAQIVSRPNFVVAMIDDLDKQSMERRKRGEDGGEQTFRSASGSGRSPSGSGIAGAKSAGSPGVIRGRNLGMRRIAMLFTAAIGTVALLAFRIFRSRSTLPYLDDFAENRAY
jgi:hypothetical protein